jgi:hypothetical protein
VCSSDLCASPTLTQAQLQTLDKGGTLTIGNLHIGKMVTTLAVPVLGTVTVQSESASGWFSKYTVDTVADANFSLVQSGACYILQRTGTSDQIGFGVPPQALDAGAQLTLNGPNASNKAIPRQSDNSYSATLYSSGVGGVGGSGSPTLAQGAYTLAGAGGANVGSFTATVTLPGDFSWTNQNTIANPIPRASPLNVTWTGGGTGLVTIAGAAMTQSGGTSASPIYSATIFNCIAPASSNNFTVPSNVLEQLPAVSGDATSNSFGTLSVLAIPDASKGQGTFSAPLTSGSNIDQGIFSYGVGSLKSTGYN